MTTAHCLQSPLLSAAGFRHGFFTRRGGVSQGPYESLNFSVGVGDSEDNVRENLLRAGRVLGTERLYFLSQVHGTECVVVRGDEATEELVKVKGDALASRRGACGVRTADCVPILVGDRLSGAALAIHAGWRGTELGVVETAITALRRLIGAPGDLLAAIGPHISRAAFEVGPEVAERLAAASPLDGVVDWNTKKNPHVDLRRIIRGQLARMNLPEAAIDDVPGCTVRDPELFFSYRRNGQKSGRHLSVIVANPS